jgi:membrane protein YqaA with SNARE-associated domain
MGLVDRLAAFAASRSGLAVAAGWGLAEAIVLPVVPDVLLYLLAAAAPAKAPRLFVATVIGALVGTALLYWLATLNPGAAREVVLAVPGIGHGTLASATAAVAGGDPASMALFGPGTPLKAYTVGWASGAGSLAGLLVGTVLNRLTRIGPVLLVAMGIGALLPGLVRQWERPLFVAYVVGWTVVYAAYLASQPA